MIEKLKKHRFLFQELVKRDFKTKYKRTVLGMGWSLLSPLLQLLVMRLVFTEFFGRNMNHYTTYLFAGNLFFNYYSEGTVGGMMALVSNSSIFSKINVPKYLFLLSKNVSAIINFGITLIVFVLFIILDGVPFSWSMLAIVYPIAIMTLLNIGIGMILSAMYVFFHDTKYLYDIFKLLLMYLSAIFYTLDKYPQEIQNLFLINPVYCCIKYVRTIVLQGVMPPAWLHLLMLGYVALFLGIGALIYKKQNHKFLYYV